MKMAFIKQKMEMDSEIEAWVSQDIDRPALGVWFAVRPPTTGDRDLDTLMTEQMRQLDGTPLKSVTHTTNRMGRREKDSTTRMEVTRIEEQEIDGERFSMPSGYREVPLVNLELEGNPETMRNLSDILGGGN